MKIIRIVIFLIFILNHSSYVFSQEKNLSIRLSVTKNYLTESRYALHISSFKPGEYSGEDDESFNPGIIVKLASNNFIEIEYEKFNFYEQEFSILGIIDDGSQTTITFSAG